MLSSIVVVGDKGLSMAARFRAPEEGESVLRRAFSRAYGAESLSYFGDDSSMPDTLFTLSEHPGYRG
ncbi:hypothetical protein [Dactylosporangium fulvum]|uniref:Uncharacterized protein n=1 Tax=Dactylosporangium fulvum TaxID=53359 RepID=A0ABY5WCD7_9ACTN|nr:hypothetical protein [Dactylosporangium fulvum]UWP87015.1 hypothetical protein Dfulv_23345 [Dactylosporangium fulvum]